MTDTRNVASIRSHGESLPATHPVDGPAQARSFRPPPRFTREVRLGLVLYGGVSLAIYINGVTQEFARAVRGQRSYRLIKALTDSDLVVDVVSGTSAGGINGIALSFALCNGLDLASLPKLWREDGDIAGLLNSANGNTPPVHSLLSGDAYQSKLRAAYESLGNSEFIPEPGFEEYVSRTSELDLFITGTYLDGFERVEFDNRGHAIRIDDHRALFKLKYRRQRKRNTDLGLDKSNATAQTTLVEALATLSRLTSGFPGAFPPIRIRAADPRDSSTVDGLLHRWGQLPEATDGYFVDGGVLDNKPFTSTLEAIFSRSATRDVNRMLFFVDPNPAEVNRPGPDGNGSRQEPDAPSFGATVMRARIDIPFVETITDDLKRLGDHNRGVALYNRIATDMLKHWYENSNNASDPERAERAKATDAIPVSPEQMLIYKQSRLAEFSQRIAQSLYNARTQHPAPDAPEPSKQAAAFVQYFDASIKSDDHVPEWLLANDIYFYRRRVYYLIYLLHSLQFNGNDDAGVPSRPADHLLLAMLRTVLNRQAELYDVLRGALTFLVQDAPPSWHRASPDASWNVIFATGTDLLERANELLPDNYEQLLIGEYRAFSTALTELYTGLRTFIQQQHTREPDNLTKSRQASSGDRSALIERLVQIERGMIQQTTPNDDRLGPIYEAFANLDAVLYPLEVVGQLGEKDNIEVIRISPIDAQRGFSRRTLEDKLSGDSVMHFGGFFKRSWRSNDILWGRLDGCCQLIECLLDPERVRETVQKPAALETLRSRFFETGVTATSPSSTTGYPPVTGAEHSPAVEAEVNQDAAQTFGAGSNGSTPWRAGMRPRDLYPHSSSRTHTILETWIRSICDGTLDTSSPEWRDNFNTMLCLLIEAEQLEILYEEVPNVIGDGLAEQETWNRFEFAFPGVPVPQPNGKSAPPLSTNGHTGPRYKDIGGRRFDPFITITAAARYVHEAADSVFKDGPDSTVATPADTRMGKFFLDDYRVGSERLTRDIPTVALLGIMARALLVLRTCLLNMFGESAGRVKHSFVYRFGLDLPLRAFYGFTILWRRWDGAKMAGLAALAGVSAILLFLGTWLWDEIVSPDGLIFNRLLIFIVVPALVLFVLFRSLVLGWALTRGRRAALYALLSVGAVAALVWGLLGTSDFFETTDINWTSTTTLQIIISIILLYTITRAVFWRLVARFDTRT